MSKKHKSIVSKNPTKVSSCANCTFVYKFTPTVDTTTTNIVPKEVVCKIRKEAIDNPTHSICTYYKGGLKW